MPETVPSEPFTRSAAIASGFVVGISENPHLGDGWHEREVHGLVGIPFRPTAARAAFRLALSPRARRVKILMFAYTSLLGRPYEGDVLLDGQTLGRIVLETESWTLRAFDLPEIATERVGEFALVSRRVFIPSRVMANCRDFRQLGCGIGAVIVEGDARALNPSSQEKGLSQKRWDRKREENETTNLH